MPIVDSVSIGRDVSLIELSGYFHQFYDTKCCGKCIPCREAAQRVCAMLDGLVGGREQDMLLLEELGDLMAATSKCRLGTEAGKQLLRVLAQHAKQQPVAAPRQDALAMAAGG